MKRIPTTWGHIAVSMSDPVYGLIDQANLLGLKEDQLNQNIRAIFLSNMIIGQVHNGGVGQLYFNCAFNVPGFNEMDRIIASHGALGDIAEFASRVLEPMEEMQQEVKEARATGEWPSSFFDSTSEKFEELEEQLFSMSGACSSRMKLHILQNLEEYYEIEEPEGWHPDYSGYLEQVHDIEKVRHKLQLTFEKGFPFGPNIMIDPATNLVSSTTLVSPDRAEIWMRSVNPVSYTHLTLPTNREV